ncbi:MAG TPA: elongation factor P maturation arginine rhamnosyltransferase EarP, partial [Burkholderiales bacterium]
MRALRSFDVFCRVVDNFGDAAVCWRLARGLAAETGAQTRLWIDDLGA